MVVGNGLGPDCYPRPYRVTQSYGDVAVLDALPVVVVVQPFRSDGGYLPLVDPGGTALVVYHSLVRVLGSDRGGGGDSYRAGVVGNHRVWRVGNVSGVGGGYPFTFYGVGGVVGGVGSDLFYS